MDARRVMLGDRGDSSVCRGTVAAQSRLARCRQAVADGGADIVDVKEPRRGSLGMADAPVIRAVHDRLRRSAPKCDERGTGPGPLLSIALGELGEWLGGEEDRRRATLSALKRCDVAYAKLGLSGCRRRPDWFDAWEAVRRTLSERALPGVRWVAVAYADEHRAASPPIEQVVEAAAATGCAGLLVDTFDKRSGTLWDALSAPRLQNAIAAARGHGLFVALAGRLRADDVPAAVAAGADVVAVRSAACAGDVCQCA